MLPQLVYIVSRLLVLLAPDCVYIGPDGQFMDRITLNELVEATGGQSPVCDARPVEFGRVTIDSRTVRPGDLFWALKGERHDGHDFLAEAVRRGAVACVAQSDRGKQISSSVPTVLVPDSFKGLNDLARWHRQRMDALVIGLTGSVGKTTTREMIHTVLGTGFEGCRSQKNYNNHVGLPLSVLEIAKRHEYAVLEMGASHVGEIRQLCDVALPEVGVVTRIGVAHLAGFGNIGAIAQAKGELVEALPVSGFAVLNGDDPRCVNLAQRARCRVITVGEQFRNTFRATDVKTAGAELRFRVDGTEFVTQAAGRHHLTAALAALAIAREVGLPTCDIAEGLARFAPVDGRCQVHSLGGRTVIDDTYNANPSSTEAACALLSEWKPAARRILVLGEMAELGDQSASWHEDAGRKAAELGIDRIVAFGQYAADVMRGARGNGMELHQLAECRDLDVLLAVLDCWTEPGDVVLVKGSRSMRMERVIEWMVAQFETSKENIGPPGNMRACA